MKFHEYDAGKLEISDARYTVITRGRGSGKTTTVLLWAIEKAAAGETVLFISNHHSYAFDNARFILEGHYSVDVGNPAYQISYVNRTLRLGPRGAGKIIFRSENVDPNDVRGEGLDDVVVDDANPSWAEDLFDELDLHLRKPKSQMVVLGTKVTPFMGVVMSSRPGEVDIDVRAVADKRLSS